MHQLDTLYQSNGCKNSSGVIWGNRGQKVIFTKKCCNSSVVYSKTIRFKHVHELETLYLCYGVIGQPGVIWGHRGQTLIFTKNALSLCYVLYQCNSCICIRLTPLQNLLAQISIWDHRGQKVFFTKNAVTSSIRLT